MKKLLSISICLILTLSFLPAVFVYADNNYFFEAREAESLIAASSGNGRFEQRSDSAASGGQMMYARTNASAVSADELPLYADDIFVENDCSLKLFVRVKGQDSIRFAVNGGAYTTKWYPFSSTEYRWEYLGELDFSEGFNTISFAVYKMSLSFDKFILTDNPVYFPIGFGQNPSESNGLSENYPAPSVTPPASHPRLFINQADVDKTKLNLEHEENKAAYQLLQTNARRNQTGKLSTTSTGNNYNNTALETARANAYMYLLTNTDSYAEKATNIMINYMATLKYKPAGSLNEIRGTGDALIAASLVYDWCHDSPSFTAQEKETLFYSCLKQADRLECGWPCVNLPTYDGGHSGENSILNDLFAFSIAVYDEHPEIYDFVAGRLFKEFIPLMNYHYNKESVIQRTGDNYGIYRYKHELLFALMLNKIGGGNLISENQRYMAYQQIIRLRPDGATFRDGDIYNNVSENGSKDVTSSDEVAFYSAVLYKDSYMKGYFKEICPDVSKGAISPAMYLAMNDVDVKSSSKETLPLAIYGGDELGIMTVRTSWEKGKASDAMLVSMKLPERYYGNHSHLDAGNFEIYYKGALAIDSGVYQSAPFYDDEGNYITSNLNHGSVHDYNYHKRTIAHNTILVFDPNETGFGMGSSNDGGQKFRYLFPHNTTFETYSDESRNVGEVISADTGDNPYSPSYTYFKGDLTGWYNPNKMSLFERSFVFLNFFDETYPGALIVFDKVVSTNAGYKKSWVLHSQEEPEINGNTTVIKRSEYGYNGKLINQTLLPAENVIAKVGGDGYEYYVNGKNYNSTPKSEAGDESGNWRTELSPAAENTNDVFLNVMTVCENDDNIVPLNAQLGETNEFYTVKIKDRVCLIPKSSEKISSSFTFTTEGEGEYGYLITGLAKGQWRISDGTTSVVKEVQEKKNALSFNGEAGTYTITKISDSADYTSIYLGDVLTYDTTPFTDTYPYVYSDMVTTAAFSKMSAGNEYNVEEFGFVYTKNENDDPEGAEARKYPAGTRAGLSGRFGVKLMGAPQILGGRYYLRTYLKYNDNGVSKTVYGRPVKIKRESEQTEVVLGDNTGIIKNDANIYSAAEQNPWKALGYNDNRMIAFNQSGKRADYIPCIAYLQLDLSKIIKELDTEKPIILRPYSRFSFYDLNTNGATYDDGIVSIYDMSGFDWENADLSTNAIAADLSAADGKELIASFSASEIENQFTGDARIIEGTKDIDITGFVKKCIEENNLTPTLGFKVTAKPVASNLNNRVVYWMYKSTTKKSYLVYNKFVYDR